MHVEWLNENYAHYKIRNYLSTEKARFIVCIVVLTSPPPKKKTTPPTSFLPSPPSPSDLQTVRVLPFLGNFLLYVLVFRECPLKIRVFSEPS